MLLTGVSLVMGASVDQGAKSIIQHQRAFFRTGITRDVRARERVLKSFYQMVRHNQSSLQDALREDLGKSAFEAYYTEIAPLLNEIDLARRNLRIWQNSRKVSTSPLNRPGYSRIEREPFGVALIAAPWNYPVYLTCVPLTSALAAGNCVVVKPSEQAPHTARLLGDLLGEVFGKELVCTVEGGPEVLLSLIRAAPDFVFFTGSRSAGCRVMKEASLGPIPLVLELGGKNPCIVERDAHLRAAARRIVWGKFVNAGQSCVAPDFVYADQSIVKNLIECCRQTLQDFYGPDPSRSLDYGRMVNRTAFKRVRRLMGKGEVVVGGHCDERSLYISPTLLWDPGWGSEVMNEEVFGPVLPFLSYRDTSECVQRIRSLSSPLALYIFTCNRTAAGEMIRSLRSGMVCVNGTMHSVISRTLPFGGFGASGMGRYHGRNGFDVFTFERSILHKSCSFDWPFVYPPYRPVLGCIKGLVRRFI